MRDSILAQFKDDPIFGDLLHSNTIQNSKTQTQTPKANINQLNSAKRLPTQTKNSILINTNNNNNNNDFDSNIHKKNSMIYSTTFRINNNPNTFRQP